MGPLRSPIDYPSRNSILTIPRSREGGQGRAPRPDGIDATLDAGAARIAATKSRAGGGYVSHPHGISY